MHTLTAAADITPADPHNPFGNPTEEPGYSPDYRAVVPELGMAGCKLPLIPSLPEKAAIRRFVSLNCLILLFAFLLSASIATALQLAVRVVTELIDRQNAGELPQNYLKILAQYMQDSSIMTAINLISFFIGNLVAFRVGCLLTRMKTKDFFRTHGVTLPRLLLYMMTGLWIQLGASYLGKFLVPFLTKAGIPLAEQSISLNGSMMKLAVLAIYTCAVAPITEELLLRGVILKNACRVSQRFGILITAFIFGLMHENLQQFLFTFPLGILLGYITVRHNSLYPAMLVHITVNTANLLMLCGTEMLPKETFRTVMMIYTLSILLIGTVSALYLFMTQRLPDNMPHQSIRSARIAFTSPLLWVLIIVHIGMGVYQNMIGNP